MPGTSVKVQLQLPDFKNQGRDFYLTPSGAVFADANGQAFVWIIDNNVINQREVSAGNKRVTAWLLIVALLGGGIAAYQSLSRNEAQNLLLKMHKWVYRKISPWGLL